MPNWRWYGVATEDGNAVVPRSTTLAEWLDYWLGNIYGPKAADTSVYGNRLIIDNNVKSKIGIIKL